MPSYEHKKLIERIAKLNVPPTTPADFSRWTEAGEHLQLVRDNAAADEFIVYASGDYTLIHSIVVSNDRLFPIDEDDLLSWGCTPYTSIASYCSGGEREGVWVENFGAHSTSSKTLDGGVQLVFARTFEGWNGPDRTYFELHQQYTHLTGIHWRPEQHAYCRYDGNGDLDHVVSVTKGQGAKDVTLVSFKWQPLQEYLAASNASLVRLFDFTLLRRGGFAGWPDGEEEVVRESDALFYRRKVLGGTATYTHGVQIIRPREEKRAVLSAMQDQWFGRGDKRYVEFIAHDFRNDRLAKISTDPSATTNYFEAKNNALPFELSPAFFRPEVLLKYKTDRDKYTVGERDVQCRAAWYLKGIDVNEAGQVHAYICYLRHLPYSEQLHWASFNEEPKTGISQRAVTHDFKGEFASFPAPLREVASIVRRWHEKSAPWWTLRDDMLLERVHTPLTASRDEWAEAFMDLAKLVNEGFELKPIRAELSAAGVAYELKEQSIVLLERLRNSGSDPAEAKQFAGLRTVQNIRSKAKGHAGGSDAQQLSQEALSQHGSYTNHFKHVCQLVSEDLRTIEELFGARS